MTLNFNDFKSIKKVQNANDLIDTILSKTQRKTPTMVHKGMQITRLRNFYMRKVKFTEQSIVEKIDQIIEKFPSIDNMHPFFSDLLNILYDRDHYKLALGHYKQSKHLISNISRDYLKMIKYADSLYRCKCLKVAALGRMVTVLKKLKGSSQFLEEVRKHLARLPSIEPNERTLLLAGFPNVGKSSFLNSISVANVDVQPYPFTTQALQIGHLEYKHKRFQIIDTPGILDRPLEQKNTIEMQTITALAHIRACILYFIDFSLECGYTINQQLALFNSIQPLFHNNPILMVLSKCDLTNYQQQKLDSIDEFNQFLQEHTNIQYFEISSKTNVGVEQLKNAACESIINSKNQKNVDNSNMPHISFPTKIRGDPQSRPPIIPLQIKDQKSNPSYKDIQDLQGGAGVYNYMIQQEFKNVKSEWQYDIVPEIFEGKNVIDFVDKEIEKKLWKLEEEEMLRLKLEDNQIDEEEDEQYREKKQSLKKINVKRNLLIQRRRQKLPHERLKPRKFADFSKLDEQLKTKIDEEDLNISGKIRSRSKRRNSQRRNSAIEEEFQSKKKNKVEINRSASRRNSRSVSTYDEAYKKMRQKIQKQWNLQGSKGVGDKRIENQKPKHLYVGKAGFQRQRR